MAPVSHLSDHFDPDILLAQAREGHDGAVQRLVSHYRSYLKMLARMKLDRQLQARLDESDLVQDVYLSAFRDFGQFRGSSEKELTAWLRQILAHVIANHARDHRRQRRDVRLERQLHLLERLDKSSQMMERVMADPVSSPSLRASRRERAVLLANALENLRGEHREVIVLRDLQGMSLSDIARQMGRSVNAVQKLWARAVIQLRRQLNADVEIP